MALSGVCVSTRPNTAGTVSPTRSSRAAFGRAISKPWPCSPQLHMTCLSISRLSECGCCCATTSPSVPKALTEAPWQRVVVEMRFIANFNTAWNAHPVSGSLGLCRDAPGADSRVKIMERPDPAARMRNLCEVKRCEHGIRGVSRRRAFWGVLKSRGGLLLFI
jgi:hypothetical protein